MPLTKDNSKTENVKMKPSQPKTQSKLLTGDLFEVSFLNNGRYCCLSVKIDSILGYNQILSKVTEVIFLKDV